MKQAGGCRLHFSLNDAVPAVQESVFIINVEKHKLSSVADNVEKHSHIQLFMQPGQDWF